MPAFIPFENVMACALRFTEFGQEIENVYHVRKDSGPLDTTDFEAVGLILHDWWEDHQQTAAPDVLSLNSIEIVDLTEESSGGMTYLLDLPLIGTVTAAHPLPLNVTVAIKWLTALRGRSYRGRTYYIGLQQEQVEDNALIGSMRSALVANYNALISAFDTTAYDLVVCSRVNNKIVRSVGVATRIISASVDVNLDSQRRRLNGRGR